MEKGKSDIHVSDDKPTGKFTFLSVDEAADAAQRGGEEEIEFPSVDMTTSSFRRLESDIRQLHSKWRTAEREFRTRATRTSQLTTELDEKDSRIQKLEEDLQLAKDEQIRLTDAVQAVEEQSCLRQQNDDELERRMHEHEAELLQKDSTISALDEQLVANDAEIGSLRSQIEEVTVNRDELQAKFAMADKKDLKSEDGFQAMRTEIETLEAELCAKRDLIEVLAHAHRADKEMVDIFDQSVDRTADVGAGNEDLDSNDASSNFDILPFRAKHLIVAIDPDGGKDIRYPLYKKEMTIGRSRTADIQIPNVYISRIHARISRQGSKAIIQDTGSTNGFLVNSEVTRRRELMHGDRLNIGTMEFEFIDLSVSQ